MAELMATKELAAYLRVSVSRIKRMLKQGELPGFQVGASWRFDPAAVAASDAAEHAAARLSPVQADSDSWRKVVKDALNVLKGNGVDLKKSDVSLKAFFQRSLPVEMVPRGLARKGLGGEVKLAHPPSAFRRIWRF